MSPRSAPDPSTALPRDERETRSSADPTGLTYVAALFGHRASMLEVGATSADLVDPLDDDAFHGIDARNDAPVRIVLAIANLLGPELADRRLARALHIAQEQAVSRPRTPALLVSEFQRVLDGGYGDLYCDPICCWASKTVLAYLIAAALERMAIAEGEAAAVRRLSAERFYGAQNLASVLSVLSDGPSLEEVRRVVTCELVDWATGKTDPLSIRLLGSQPRP